MNKLNKSPFVTVVLLTVLFSIVGFGLMSINLVPYGFTLFCIMPVLIGYIIGQYPKFRITIVVAGVLGIMIFLFLLVLDGLESLFCILTLSPLLYLLLFIGMYIGYQARKWRDKKQKDKNGRLGVYVLPVVLLFMSSFIEKFFTEKYTEVRIETKIILPYPKEQVFDYVKSFDTLTGKKPFMFRIGIQTPLKCVLEKDSVGAKRVCYFKEGTIDEVVTRFERGNILQMNITKYNMPGRKWLHFQDAIYLFKDTANGTELTRITTYKSELKPRFYWSFWEEKAVRAEHDYVLASLRKRLDEGSRGTR